MPETPATFPALDAVAQLRLDLLHQAETMREMRRTLAETRRLLALVEPKSPSTAGRTSSP